MAVDVAAKASPDASRTSPPTTNTPVSTTEATAAGERWFVPVLVLSIGGFMSVLDSSIVNVAVPAMQNDFGTSTDDIEWVATAYSLSLGVIVPVSAWLGARFGMRSTYVWSMIAFAATSILCGVAWDLTSMVVFRVLQAIPGGILPVISMAMLYKIAPKEKIGAAMAVYGLGVVFAPGIGPTLGGYLVDYSDWRWVFFINGPAGVIGAALALWAISEFPREDAGRFDRWGFVTIAGSLFALLLAFSEGQSWGWDSYPVLILFTASALLLALFVVIELEVDEPLINVRVFLLWQFSNSLLLITALSVGLFAVVFYVPIFLQLGQGRTAMNTGLIMFPEAIAMAAAMPLAGWMYDRLGPRIPVLLGLGTAAWGTYMLCGLSADVTAEQVILATCIRGAGNGLGIMTIMTAGLAVVPANQINEASAVNNIVQRVSAALGLAILTGIATDHQAQGMLDRASSYTADGLDPTVAAVAESGPTGMAQLHKWLQTAVMADAYGDLFLLLAWFTGAGAVLGLLVKKPPVQQDGDDQPRIIAH